jgi:cellulose synthase/poly-beta-1,6-N-acetylglucosamine synthase-like glycosyltransferase
VSRTLMRHARRPAARHAVPRHERAVGLQTSTAVPTPPRRRPRAAARHAQLVRPSSDPPPGGRRPGAPAIGPRLLPLALVLGLATAVLRSPVATVVYGILVITIVLLLVAAVSVTWQSYAWRTPETFSRTGLAHLDQPRLSFSVLVPARHEEDVLGATIAGLAAVDHPSFEIVVVVGHDDPGTMAVAHEAAARARVPVKVVVDHHETKNKPKALNTGLPYCGGDVVMVIDAEDDVRPGLLRLADTAFRRHAADIVQTGVQLMDFDKSWWTARNVLEYFFWFRSRLHFHAAQRFITLGGTSIAIRRDLLEHLGGWDERCLAEDCDLGVRASAIGARVAVVYEPEHTTREETPPNVRAFVKQRVRWMQGFIQVLTKGDWRRLPHRRQRLQAAVVLATPLTQCFAGVVAPVCVVTALALKSPVLVVLATFLPLVPGGLGLAFDVVGLGDFGRTFGRRIRWRDYWWVIVSTPVYQILLSAAAVWATVRHLLGRTDWHKTQHVNSHREAAPELQAAA